MGSLGGAGAKGLSGRDPGRPCLGDDVLQVGVAGEGGSSRLQGAEREGFSRGLLELGWGMSDEGPALGPSVDRGCMLRRCSSPERRCSCSELPRSGSWRVQMTLFHNLTDIPNRVLPMSHSSQLSDRTICLGNPSSYPRDPVDDFKKIRRFNPLSYMSKLGEIDGSAKGIFQLFGLNQRQHCQTSGTS